MVGAGPSQCQGMGWAAHHIAVALHGSSPPSSFGQVAKHQHSSKQASNWGKEAKTFRSQRGEGPQQLIRRMGQGAERSTDKLHLASFPPPEGAVVGGEGGGGVQFGHDWVGLDAACCGVP